MSLCLGKGILIGGRKDGPQTPGRMRSARKQHVNRPKKFESRSEQFNISLTVSELADIKARAEAVGMRPVHFGRALLFNQDIKVSSRREPSSNAERLIYGQLVRLGNNLNQMVRHLHQTGDPLPADLDPLLKDIRQILARRHRDDR